MKRGQASLTSLAGAEPQGYAELLEASEVLLGNRQECVAGLEGNIEKMKRRDLKGGETFQMEEFSDKSHQKNEIQR